MLEAATQMDSQMAFANQMVICIERNNGKLRQTFLVVDKLRTPVNTYSIGAGK